MCWKCQGMIYLISILFLGTIDDGWAIDEQLGKNTQAIITQVSSPCPEKVNRGFVLKQDMNYDSGPIFL